ncbi:guanine nucleotide-binding protein g(o) subunit alpha [Anaeramoeba ignava]|uniref:Guanine nucleotide-binding protein g(O) subunit alpha n=1 Tax=Anaeramoeba ignava TaxID=1746090 RepID=A0A9Q0RG52_ANAIG|nr:guanine nucleotide-binding protein g(o) subunit alpha [Anaeramoeba ignava]
MKFHKIKTTGITETQFSTKDLSFILIDVGGQRNERKKWIHCFQGVTALIFCVSASEYDQTLFEDENQNRMHESISLFAEICDSQWFQATSIILFFNKMDLFEQKIKKVDLKVCFNDYEGGKDEKKAIDFIKEKFLSLNKNKDRQIYPHETCATNTDNIRKVFEGVKETLLKTVL